MELTFDQHTSIIKLLRQDQDKSEPSKWISVISFLDQIPESEISAWPLDKFLNRQKEIANLINNLVLDAKEIKTFEFKNKTYTVDTVVFNANTALYADYITLVERYQTSLDLYKHIVSLLIFESDPIYTTQRYEQNLFLVGKLPAETVHGIASFFLRLVENLQKLSQQYSKIEP